MLIDLLKNLFKNIEINLDNRLKNGGKRKTTMVLPHIVRQSADQYRVLSLYCYLWNTGSVPDDEKSNLNKIG